MELTELLKKLQKIEPNAEYTRKSRHLIMVTGKGKNLWPVFSLKRVAANLFQSGFAIAMTAALLLLIFGSFSLWKIFSPANPLAAELTGLQAEAQAIDIQIQLTNIAYREPALLENKTSTASFVPRATPAKDSSNALNPNAAEEAKNLGLTPTGSSTADLINEALDQLSQ